MANTAYKGHECQVGKVSEEGRCDHVCPYMEHLWRVWHRQGPSSQSTWTVLLGKTTKYVMKIIHFSHSAYLLNANQIIVWHFFQPELKLAKWLFSLWWGWWQDRHWAGDLPRWPPTGIHRDRQAQRGQRVQQRVDQGPFQVDGGENFFILLHTNTKTHQNVSLSS